MKHSIATLFFLIAIHVCSGQCCQCAKCVAAAPVVDCPSLGYQIQVPLKSTAKLSYSLDFVVEQPVPPPQPAPCRPDLIASIPAPAPAPCELPAPLPPPAPAPPACTCGACTACLSPPPPPPPPACTCGACTTCLSPPPPPPPPPCTCGACTSCLSPPVCAPTPPPIPPPMQPPSSCPCGCSALKPCRYVLAGLQSNAISRLSGRHKRDASSSKLAAKLQAAKASREARAEARKAKKASVSKRSIRGEYDMLAKERAAADLTIPDIIQYMPETLNPNFQRGKCNIGCENCNNQNSREHENKPHPENDSNINNQQQQQNSQQYEQHLMDSKENTPTMQPSQQINAADGSASYLKRSVNLYQLPCSCKATIMPPPYIPSTMQLMTIAQNPGYPIWYQPRPLIDPNGHYVYDRLGHKYEVKNGSLKLVTPMSLERSAPDDSVVNGNANAHAHAHADTMNVNSYVTNQQLPQVPPMVPVAPPVDPFYDPQMDKVIRDIIYKHPNFIDATQHAQGSLTLPVDVQTGETLHFLEKLIRGRLNAWFGHHAGGQQGNIQDITRHSRETSRNHDRKNKKIET